MAWGSGCALTGDSRPLTHASLFILAQQTAGFPRGRVTGHCPGNQCSSHLHDEVLRSAHPAIHICTIVYLDSCPVCDTATRPWYAMHPAQAQGATRRSGRAAPGRGAPRGRGGGASRRWPPSCARRAPAPQTPAHASMCKAYIGTLRMSSTYPGMHSTLKAASALMHANETTSIGARMHLGQQVYRDVVEAWNLVAPKLISKYHARPLCSQARPQQKSAHLHAQLELQLALELAQARPVLLGPGERGRAVVRVQRVQHAARALEDVRVHQRLIRHTQGALSMAPGHDARQKPHFLNRAGTHGTLLPTSLRSKGELCAGRACMGRASQGMWDSTRTSHAARLHAAQHGSG